MGEGSIFNDIKEVLTAYQNGYVHLHTRIALPVRALNKTNFSEEEMSKLVLTTPGKLIFNEILPTSFPYVNEPTALNLEQELPEKYVVPSTTDVKEEFKNRELIQPFKKGFLGDIIAAVFKNFQIIETSKMLDRMKDLGFHYSTKAGITVGISDIVVLPDKQDVLTDSEEQVSRVMKQFRRGLITEEERYDKIISIWGSAKDVIQEKLMGTLDITQPYLYDE
jgi:DNA-directed RNA polymerase subunit beta'